MRKFLILLLFSFGCINAQSATTPGKFVSNIVVTPTDPVTPVFDFTNVKIKTIEKLLGRKLKLKEKAAIKFYQWKLRKGITVPAADTMTNKGKTAMILGIVSIASFFIPYVNIASLPCAILAIIFGNQARKVDPKDGKALTGVILGWVTIGLILLAIAIVIIVLSSWGWGGWG